MHIDSSYKKKVKEGRQMSVPAQYIWDQKLKSPVKVGLNNENFATSDRWGLLVCYSTHYPKWLAKKNLFLQLVWGWITEWLDYYDACLKRCNSVYL